VIVPVHRKVDKTDCNNYRGISLPSTSYIDFIHLSDTGEKWEYVERVCQLFIDFKKALLSEEGNIVQHSHRVWGTHEISWADQKRRYYLQLIKMCLNETYSKVCIHKICIIVFLSRVF
jgi:hypothetical protein